MGSEQGKFNQARKEIEGSEEKHPKTPDKSTSPAGPHAKAETTNHDATPGAGSLPSTKPSKEVEAGTG